jgi:hypothetical protein
MIPVVVGSGKVPLEIERRCIMAEKRTGYGGRWKKWLAIYLVAAAVAYLIVYLVFFYDGGGNGGGLY